MPASKRHTLDNSKAEQSKRKRSRAAALAKARLAKKATAQNWTEAASTSTESPPSQKLNTPLDASSPSTLGLTPSASVRKLNYFPTTHAGHANPTSLDFSTIVQLDCLPALFKELLCPECGEPALDLVPNLVKGLSVELSVVCQQCSSILNTAKTSKQTTNSTSQVNSQMVAASIASGHGRAGIKNFCELMNMPVMHHKTYNNHVRIIHRKNSQFSRTILSEAHDVVRDAYPKQKGKDVIDIDVSYDGSWHTRGHKSNLGIGCIIENRTGLVIDYQCLSKYCHECATTGKKLENDVDKFTEWQPNHLADCDKNHEGSSGSMEQYCAVKMWQRSVTHGFRYRTVICDGDTNTIKKIHECNPYQDLIVEKRECINHVAKRLGTALKKVVEDKKKVKITLGGNGKGKLTQQKIAKFQKYYIKAIRSNSTVADMKRAIWAIFNHCSSTNSEPKHDDCPDGNDSWCFFNKAKARRLSTPDHEKHQRTPITPFVADHIKPAFERLSADDLLEKCVEGKSQNVNECLHSVIWNRCPKHISVGRKRLEVSVSVGVGEFNKGARAGQDFLLSLGLNVGEMTKKYGVKRDSERKRKSDKACEESAKRRREVRRLAQSREEERLMEEEGGAQYAAGEF